MHHNSGSPQSGILAGPADYLPFPLPRRRTLLNASVAGRAMVALPAALSIGIVLAGPAHAQLTPGSETGGVKLSTVSYAGYKSAAITSASTISSAGANLPSASAVYGSMAAVSNAGSLGGGIDLAGSFASGADIAAPGYGVTIGNLAHVAAHSQLASAAIAQSPASATAFSGPSLAAGPGLAVPIPGPGGYSGAAGLGAAGAIINRSTIAGASGQDLPSLSSAGPAMADGSFNRDSGGIFISSRLETGRAPEAPFAPAALPAGIFRGRDQPNSGDMPGGLAITNSSGGILTGGAVTAIGGPDIITGGGFGFHASGITETAGLAVAIAGVDAIATYGGILTARPAEAAGAVNTGVAPAHETVITTGYGKISGHEGISLEVASRITNASAPLATGLLSAIYIAGARETVAYTSPMTVSAADRGAIPADAAPATPFAGGGMLPAQTGPISDETAGQAAIRLGGSQIASAASSAAILPAAENIAALGATTGRGNSEAGGPGAASIGNQTGIIATEAAGITLGGSVAIESISAAPAGKLGSFQEIAVDAAPAATGMAAAFSGAGPGVNFARARPAPAGNGIAAMDASGAMPTGYTPRGTFGAGVLLAGAAKPANLVPARDGAGSFHISAGGGLATNAGAEKTRQYAAGLGATRLAEAATSPAGSGASVLAAPGGAGDGGAAFSGIAASPPAIARSGPIAAASLANLAELPADPANTASQAMTRFTAVIHPSGAPGSALISGSMSAGSSATHSVLPAIRGNVINATESAAASASAGPALVIRTVLQTDSFAPARPAGVIGSTIIIAAAPPILPADGVTETQNPALDPSPFNPAVPANSFTLADTVIADTPNAAGALFGGNPNAADQAISGASRNGSDAGIINAGRIIAAAGTGLALNGGSLFNAPSGVIQGDPAGVTVTGGGAVTNAGLILDAGTAGLELGSFSHVTNLPTGTIAGTVGLEFTGTGSAMLNEGTIASTSGGDAVSFSSFGVNSLTLTTGQTLIGTIDGGGSSSTIALDGAGTLTNTITDFGPASSLDVAPSADWTAYGSWQIHTATNDGIFQPGIIGTPLSLAGNFVQNADGTLQIIVTPAATNQLLATGTARLDGSLNYTFAPGTYVAKTYPFLVTGGATTGTFASITYNAAPANLLHATTYETNDTSLVLYDPGSPAPASNPVPNPPLVVAPIDDSIFSDENQQNALNAQAASMSLLQKAAEGDQEDAEAAVCASEAGATPADVEPDKTTGTAQLANAAGNAFCGAGGWIQATGTIFNADGNAGVDGYRTGTAGFLAGIGKVINTQGTRLGVAVGYDESNVKTSLGSKGDIDTVRVGLYGSQPVGVFTIAADFMYGHFDTTTSRVTGIGEAGSKESGDIFSGGIEAETLLPINGYDIIPAAGIRIAAVNTGGFAESAPGVETAFALTGANSGYDSVQPFINIDLSRKFVTPNDIAIMPDILAGYVYEAGTRGRAVTVDSQDGTAFETAHAGLAGSAAELQAGLSAGEGNWAFYARYTADLAGNWTSQSAEAGLRIRF